MSDVHDPAAHKRVRDVPDAVAWHEGMLLAPQHFQQSGIRHETLLHYHLGIGCPFHWGVRELTVDSVSLSGGTFRVTELEAILPDGLAVAHSSATGDLSVSLKPFAAEAMAKPVTVHLLVATRRASEGGGNGALKRYGSYEGVPVSDLSTGASELSFPQLRPALELRVGDEMPDKYTSIPLARITSTDGTKFSTASNYIPPMLNVSPSTPLGLLCTGIAESVRRKAMYFSDRSLATAVVQRTPLLLDAESIAESLAAGLPPLEAMIKAGVSHPYQLYLQLCTFVGLASGARRAIVPPVFETYDHNDLRATFEQITRFIDDLLAGIGEEYEPVPFEHGDGVFELTIRPAWLARASRLFVGSVAGPGATEDAVATWLESAMIASRSKMHTLRERRILGPGRVRIAAPDARSATSGMGASSAIAPRRGEVIFAIDLDTDYIEAEQVLQIRPQVDGDRGQPREIVLYVASRH